MHQNIRGGAFPWVVKQLCLPKEVDFLFFPRFIFLKKIEDGFLEGERKRKEDKGRNGEKEDL